MGRRTDWTARSRSLHRPDRHELAAHRRRTDLTRCSTRPYDQQNLFSRVEHDRSQRALRRTVIPERQNRQLNIGNDADRPR